MAGGWQMCCGCGQCQIPINKKIGLSEVDRNVVCFASLLGWCKKGPWRNNQPPGLSCFAIWARIYVFGGQQCWNNGKTHHLATLYSRLGSVEIQSRSSLDRSHFVARSQSRPRIFGCRVYKSHILLSNDTLDESTSLETVSVSVSPPKKSVSGTTLLRF